MKSILNSCHSEERFAFRKAKSCDEESAVLFLLVAWIQSQIGVAMKIKVIVHQAEEGGYWAKVPAIPGCATQGETFEELLKNLYEAGEGCLSVV